MAVERSEIIEKDRWKVEAMYPSIKEWESDFKQSIPSTQPHWPGLAKFKGHLGDSPEALLAALEQLFAIDRKLSQLYTYIHLRHDEEITEDTNKSAWNRIMGIIHDFHLEASWFEPELLTLPEEKIKAYLQSPLLKEYRFHLEKTFRIKPHVLPPEQEELVALAGKSLQTIQKTFSALNDADFKFGTVKNGEGKELELTHGSYGLYMRDQDRTLRKNAFLQMHKQYEGFENTLSELIQGQTEAHLFSAKAHKYASCLDAALFPKNIDTSVYHALIQAVNDEIGVLHKYVALRKEVLPGIDQIHLYDMYVPLTSQFDMLIPYEEAEDLVIESVAPLGSEYQEVLRKGFKQQGWVDRYENKNKRSGAYSSGCYDSFPYILMNYKKILRDVFTLAHEAGHSMHSYLSHKNQPYQYGDYPIFLAEVASTFNEELLMRLMLKRAKTLEEKIYLLTQKVEDIRTTLFRQTMFAEFELKIHQLSEQNIPLTPNLLKQEFRELNARYFGPTVVIDKEAEIEWSRIPHFYYNFYVFQYATGISAALALAEKVVSGGEAEREAYLSFLKGGSSRYPIEMLKLAGVDMSTPQPVKATIKRFSLLVDELKELIKSR